MTTLDERPAEALPARPSRRSRRRTAVAVIGVAALAVAGAVLGVVRATDVAALEQVHVFLDSGSFVCERSGDVTSVGLDAESGSAWAGGYRVPALALRSGLDCRMSVVVRNDSDRTIDVDRVELPFFGPSNGWGVEADLMYTQGLQRFGSADDVDAVFDFVRDPENRGPYFVRASSAQRLDFHVLWNPRCVSDGASGTFAEAPVLTLTSGLVTLDRGGEGPGYAVVGTTDSAARC